MSTVQPESPPIDIRQAVLWQYEQAEKIKELTLRREAWLRENHEDFWAAWYRDVFNLDTAKEFGLAVWARILDAPLDFVNEEQSGKVPFGFGSFNQNFRNANFGQQPGSVQGLTLEQRRILLKLRYAQITSRCTVPDINEALAGVFGQGQAYVIDPQDMSFAIFVFGFQPDSSLQLLLEKFDILPRPSAVGARYIVITRPVFGFGPFNQNFFNSTLGA